MASLFRNIRTISRWQAAILGWILKLYGLTLRITVRDEHGVLEQCGKAGMVMVTWHNRLLLAPLACPLVLRRVMQPLVSNSRDGEYIAAILKRLQISCVRGSSSNGGFRALMEMNQAILAKKVPCLTVDGPRGPLYTVHPGAVMLGQHTHAPVVPVAFNSSRYWSLHSWDKMQIARPFSRVEMVIGAPMCVEGLEVQDACAEVGRQLQALSLDGQEAK